MKEILCTVLLLGAVLLIYESTVGGDEGLHSKVAAGGGRVQDSVSRLNP